MADEGAVGDVESVNQSMFILATAPLFLSGRLGEGVVLASEGLTLA